MEHANDPVKRCAEAVFDGLKQVGDVSYAILPADIAHALGDLKKAFLANIRSAVDWEIEWINERIAGGDKLRNEWREKCERQSATEPPTEAI